jgi:hypothetical protein
MTYAKGLVVIGDEGSLDGLAGSVVVPDRGGQGEDALQDSDHDARWGVAAVALQVKLAFEGVVDGFDDLAQRLEEAGARPFWFAVAGGAQQADAAVGQDGFEVVPVVVLVRDDDLAAAAGGQGGVGQDVQEHLALVRFGAGQGEADGQAVQGAQQVQAQAQK